MAAQQGGIMKVWVLQYYPDNSVMGVYDSLEEARKAVKDLIGKLTLSEDELSKCLKQLYDDRIEEYGRFSVDDVCFGYPHEVHGSKYMPFINPFLEGVNEGIEEYYKQKIGGI